HRHAYILANGPIPEDKPFVCHRCDRPSCFRPNHLWAGTNAENLQDAAQKGRAASKLTPDQVRAIAALCTDRTRGDLARLGRVYGVSPQTIFDIAHGRT